MPVWEQKLLESCATMHNHYDECVQMITQRGVTMEDIADCVLFLQSKFHPEITREQVLPHIESILNKREVQHAVLTGISIDIATEKKKIESDTLQEILQSDASLYGVDEVLAYGICNLYGSIALTNYGHIDRVKPGIIAKLNCHNGECHTFLDDIVGAIAASAASRIAHQREE